MRRPKIVQEIADVMHKKYPDALIFLYGSEARGEARADSDIDLLILVDKNNITLNERMEMREPLYDIELNSGIQISPYFETVRNWNSRTTEFTEVLKREGRML